MKCLKVFLFVGWLIIAGAHISTAATAAENISLDRDDSISAKIIGGEDAVKSQFPWHVTVLGIVENSPGYCGGTLISNQWILTSAACVHAAEIYKIGIGSIYLEAPQISILATNVTQHPGFFPVILENDIALIQLPDPITFSENIQKINLPPLDYEDALFVNETGIITGFGQTNASDPEFSPILQWANYTVVSNDVCTDIYGPFLIRPSVLCAGGATPEQNVCRGDFGNPLVLEDEDYGTIQIGIVSFLSMSQCRDGAPNGFTRVTSYLRWINEVTGLPLST